MATGKINKDDWKYSGQFRGTTARDLPSDAREYFVTLQYGTSGGAQQLAFPFTFPNDYHITNTFTAGYYLSATTFSFGQINVNCNTHKVQITLMNISGVDYSATSYLNIYYR